jgi:outer membrane receptor protein involved in Fe transport
MFLRQVRALLPLLLAVPLLIVPSAMFSQEITANLGGTIKDSTGAVVPGAKVTLTNTNTNVSRSITSASDGGYIFTLVPVGTYQLTVEKPGFSKYVQQGIILQINQNAKQDVALKIGGGQTTVEVHENVAQVDTVTAQLGAVETTQRIQDLPLVERDTFQLGLLQAGVFTPDQDDGSHNPFNVSGQRSESLTFLVDGVDNTDFLDNRAAVDPNPDAVQEFRILTNNYNAEFGRTSGGIVNQVIRSGTNGYHGSAFEFIRNDDLNARNYFAQSRAVFKRNIFGGTFGGPIKKDKTFFFVAYQGARRIEGEQAPVLTVLTPQERGCTTVSAGCVGTMANFSDVCPPATCTLTNPLTGNPYAGNLVPINPIMGKYIAAFLPLPNFGSNEFVSNPVGRTQDDQGIIRIDHHFSDSDTLYGSYIIDDNRDVLPFIINHGASTGGDVPVGSGFSDAVRRQQGSVTWTHVFSPRILNEAVFGANRVANLQAKPLDTSTPASLGFTNVNPDDPAGTAPPIMFTPSFNLGPSPQGPTTLHDVSFQWADNISWNHGHHDMKFGVEVHRIRDNFRFDFFNNGSYDFADFQSPFTGNALADFVGGFPDNFFQFSFAQYGIRATNTYFYGQDSWKITPTFTLDYGLRYEYNGPQTDPHGEIMGFFPGTQSKVFPQAPPDLLYPGDPGTPNRAMVFPDRNNFAPRLGFAWDMLGNSKLVMRGGGGIFYDIEDGALNLQFGGQPPFGDVSNLNYASFTPGVDPIADPFNAFAPGTVNPFPFLASGRLGQFFPPKVSFAFVVDPHFRTPYSINFNYGFQYQVAKNTVAEVYYVGSLGRKLITSADFNFRDPNLLAFQVANAPGGFNPDCARPLAGCTDPALGPNPTLQQILLDPNASLQNEAELETDHSNGTSDSHELQTTVDHQFGGGFNLRGAYTYGHTIDNQSGFRSRSSFQTDPLNINFDRASADFDVRHRLVISGLWQLPWDKPFRGGNSFMRRLLEGWELSGIATYQTGTPFTIFNDNGTSLQGNGLDRANIVGPIQYFNPRNLQSFTAPASGVGPGSCIGSSSPGNYWFNPMAFDCGGVPSDAAAILSGAAYGDSGRNSVRGPGIDNYDLAIEKHIKFTERTNLEIRSEFFNAFNHAEFLNPDANGFSGTFGQITQARDPRIIQFAMKFQF